MDLLKDHFPVQSGGAFTRTQNRAISTSLQIRPAGAADYTAWLPLREGYRRSYKIEIAAAANDATWQRFLDANEPMNAALAWLDERAMGLAYWVYHRSCWTVGDYYYLRDLFVAGGLRGKGMGHRLIGHIYAEAGTAGCSRVHRLTRESDSDAMRLYECIAGESGFLQYRRILWSLPCANP